MDNTNQAYYQQPQPSAKNPKIGLILIGLAIGIIITAIVFLGYNYIFNNSKNIVNQVQEFTRILNENLSSNPSVTSKDFSSVETYTKEISKDKASVLFLATLNEEKIKSIYGIDEMSAEDAEYAKATSKVAIQSNYIKEKNVWKLLEEPKIYQAVDLKTVIESLGVAQDKSRDVYIKADLSSTRASAELYASNHNNSYLNFNLSEDAKRAEADINKYSTLIWGANKPNSWAACAELTTGNYYCADGTGTAKETAIPCNSKSIVCP